MHTLVTVQSLHVTSKHLKVAHEGLQAILDQLKEDVVIVSS